jgi:transposase
MNAVHDIVSDASEKTLFQQEIKQLKERVLLLENQVDWYKKQIFGVKSEKRPVEIPGQEKLLLTGGGDAPPPAEGESVTITYQRGKAPKVRSDECVTDNGLRFSADVPVKVIQRLPDELKGEEADQYEIIGTRTTYRLAQRPASYVVLKYETPILKHKEEEAPRPSPAPFNVLERSCADVSFLVGMILDKFQYHLPLYRQHQRLAHAGITLSRATLTNLVRRAAYLLSPIAEAMLENILNGDQLTMDETPIKAGRGEPGKMKQGYMWPIYGADHEIVFMFSSTRGQMHIENALKKQFKGTLLCDGYSAYSAYIEKSEQIKLAQCWVHTRRNFIEAESLAPTDAAHAISLIGALYKIEEGIKEKNTEQRQKRRLEESKPWVDQFFEWCENILSRCDADYFPTHPIIKAVKYALKRQSGLRLFLEDPDLPLDTNHIERQIRPIALGRKNWMFCWTELGAEQTGVLQSLISTCKLHGVDPYAYLTDVLLRVNTHPASRVIELTPRIWKEMFGHQPLRSDLYDGVYDVVE